MDFDMTIQLYWGSYVRWQWLWFQGWLTWIYEFHSFLIYYAAVSESIDRHQIWNFWNSRKLLVDWSSCQGSFWVRLFSTTPCLCLCNNYIFFCVNSISYDQWRPSRMTNDVALGAVVVCEALCASWPPVSVVECDDLGDLLCTKLVLFKILFKASVFGNQPHDPAVTLACLLLIAYLIASNFFFFFVFLVEA